jgi:hypothetical protein
VQVSLSVVISSEGGCVGPHIEEKPMKHSLADFTSALPTKIPTEPEQPIPWCQLDPEDALGPWDEFEEPEQLSTIPMVLGPAPDGPAGPASGVDLGTGLMAADLNWKV